MKSGLGTQLQRTRSLKEIGSNPGAETLREDSHHANDSIPLKEFAQQPLRARFIVDPNSRWAVHASNSKFKFVSCKCAPRERFCLIGTRLCHHPSFYLIRVRPPFGTAAPIQRL